jgi:hypothetical protein
VQHDDVRRLGPVGSEVPVPALDAVLHSRFTGQVRRGRVVSGRQLHHRRSRRSGLQQLDLDCAHATAGLEHRPALDAVLPNCVDDPTCGPVEPLPPVPCRVAPCLLLAEELVVTGACAAAGHDETLRRGVL